MAETFQTELEIADEAVIITDIILPGEDDDPEFDEESGPSDNGTLDEVRLYLKEVRKTLLLTPEQEKDLAQRLVLGKNASVRLQEDGCNPKEIAELQETVERGKLARDRLIRANLRLVISFAKQYQGPGVYFLDLVQEGNLGLIRAVDKFDPDKGYRLSTYASFWIRSMIIIYLEHKNTNIRTPSHAVALLKKIHTTEGALQQELDRSPTDEEIAQEMGIDSKKVTLTKDRCRPTKSLDQPVGEDDSGGLDDLLPDPNAVDPEEMAFETSLKKALETILYGLKPREAEVLRLRFGLEDGRTHTLEEIGREFGITKARVGQILSRALRRLRNPERNLLLSGYLNSPADKPD